ncbi:sugar kinase [Albirhodobacter sp. R86504]|jgi:2-dehydro-3-deoxygluconokinase|uniref:sugar kinase n=1 Tax=Albirhodobacter sp. R86504 TaxID=3093848 RepID=UPI003671A6AD
MRVLAIGECMVEMAPTGVDAQFSMGFAGDTMNTAWYLARISPFEIGYFTAIGTDAVSDRMANFLQNAGIGTQSILRRPDRTVGLYLIELKDGERSFAYWRGQAAAKLLASDEIALRAALSEADVAYFSGITLAILSPDDRVKFLEALKAFKGRVIFDTNLRPRLWASLDEMRDAISAAAAVADLVLPSYDDEAAYFGDADPEATAMRYTAAEVIVKNGGDEVLARVGDEITRHSLPKLDAPVDTTAAGDSFNAGFLAARLAGQPVGEAILNGHAVASKVIMARGALVDL